MQVDCPRCGHPAELDDYGPCGRCVDELRATVRGEGHERVIVDYEPTMHVTPNAVALKD